MSNREENLPTIGVERDSLSSFDDLSLSEDADSHPFDFQIKSKSNLFKRMTSPIISFFQSIWGTLFNVLQSILSPLERYVPEKIVTFVKTYPTLLAILLIFIPVIFGFILFLVVVSIVFLPLLESIPSDPIERAKYMAERNILIDTHNDWPNKVERLERVLNRTIDLRKRITKEDAALYESVNDVLHTDIPRMREGELRGQFWSVYASCHAEDPVQESYRQFEMVYELLDRYPEDLTFASTSKEIHDTFSDSKKIISLIGVEGGHLLGKGEELLLVLRSFYRFGARYMTLTHSCDTHWAKHSSSTSNAPGLTPLGEKIVLEMNRLGMMVDLSHTHPDTMVHAIAISKAPVIFSHSGAFKVCEHPRNVPDHVIDLIKEMDGVIMINYYNVYVSEKTRLKYEEIIAQNPDVHYSVHLHMLREWEQEDPINNQASISDVCDHIDYLKSRMNSTKHIGIGADYDGVTLVPRGLEDVSKHYLLGAELYRRGYTDDEIIGIFGSNLLRVMEKVENVAKYIQNNSNH